MTELENYKLSTYQTIETIRQTESAIVELTECSLDQKQYIRKTYPADKRSVFHILMQLDSPNIPKVHEVFLSDNTIIIEQYIPGTTLETLLVTGHPFTRTEVLTIFEDILSAITLLHKNKLIHRDIKPGNIMVTPDGRAVLIDYNIARIPSENRTEDTELLGTVGYAPPEQFGFAQTDYRTDIYAFGITMKRLANYQRFPKKYSHVLEKCTRFDPAKRFQNTDEIWNYLKRADSRLWLFVPVTVVIAICILGIFCLRPNHDLQAPPPASLQAEEVTVSEADFKTGQALTEGPDHLRLVDTFDAAAHVPCLLLHENMDYETSLSLSGNRPDVQLSVTKFEEGFSLTVDNGPTYYFEQDESLSAESYPDGKIYGELIFYDLNGDGALEIIPILSNAVCVRPENDSPYFLKNYTLGWCIYYDEANGFTLAEGRISAVLDSLKIYASMPQCINGDFPLHYTLTDGALVEKDFM